MTSPETWLHRQAVERSNTIALQSEGGRCTFAELDRRVETMAHGLSAAGVPPGHPLGCVIDRAETLALLALAAPRAGFSLFPANPNLASGQIDGLFQTAALTTVLSDQASRQVSLSRRVIAPPSPEPYLRLASRLPSLLPTAVQLIIATSGSSGAPRGAMLTGGNLAAAVHASRHRLPLGPGDVWLGCLPLHHIGGLSVLFRCLEAGATILLHRRFDARTVAADLADGNATHVSLVPAMLGQLLDQGCRPSPRLRHVLVGGASLPLALAERAVAAGWPIHPSYGLSEAASQVATCVSAIGWRPGLAGEPLPGIEISTSPQGRIRLRGPSVMAGYVNAGLHPGDGLDADGWFETGDLGGLDASNCLQVLGRADDILVSGGENVHPVEVEGLAGRCPGVRAIGVTGKADPEWGDRVVAVVVGEVTEPAFLDWCSANVPSHLRPRQMLRVEALPVTAGGKIDRRALRRLADG